jgi:uncharacterized Zn finger protein
MTPEQLASKWIIKYPYLKERVQKALTLINNVKAQGEGVYVVTGDGGRDYIIWADPSSGRSTCTCEDSNRGNHCKHRLATALIYASLKKSYKMPLTTLK